jgi:hypothetical protein
MGAKKEFGQRPSPTRHHPRTGVKSRLRGSRRLGAVLALPLLAAGFVLYLLLGLQLSFFNDDWYFLFQRPGVESKSGLDSLLAPHNGNFVAIPSAIYKLLVLTFGLTSQAPYRVVLSALIVLVAGLMYLLVSRRTSPVIGVAVAAVCLFLGPAWEDLLFFASIDLIGSLAFGLAALWALDELTRKRSIAGCVLLVCAVACSNVGIAFAVGALVLVLQKRRMHELWVAVIPLVVFGVWWLAYGHKQPSHLSAHNLIHLPRYVLDSASAGLASLTGINRGGTVTAYTRGHFVLLALALVIVAWLAMGGRPTRSVLVPVVILLAFWLLTGLGYYVGREPFASRYQLIDAVLILLVLAEGVSTSEVRDWFIALIAVASIAVVVLNVTGPLRFGYRFLHAQASIVKTDLGVLQSVRSRIEPNLSLMADVARNPYLSGITGARYLSVTRSAGVPATSPVSKIMSQSLAVRESADGVLAAAEELHPRLLPGVPLLSGCVSLTSADAVLTAGRPLYIRTVRAVAGILGAWRFGTPSSALAIGFVPARGADEISAPLDGLPGAWHLAPYRQSPSTARLQACHHRTVR